MITFNDIKYEHLDYEQTRKNIKALTSELRLCTDKESFLKTFKKINDIAISIESNCEYVEIRNSRNLSDQYYDQEMAFWNSNKDRFDLLFTEIYEICDSISFKEELYNVIPENFFHTINFRLKTTSSEIHEEREKEALLLQKYKKLITTKLTFRGELYNMAGMRKFLTDNNRATRKEASDVCNDFFLLHQKEFDDIFENLVKTRNKIANKLGYENYAQMSCYLLRRFGYGYKEIEKFRESIIKYILPINERLDSICKKNLGVDSLTYYDTIFYKDGNPTSLVLGDELLQKMESVFEGISLELKTLYKEMIKYFIVLLITLRGKNYL